MENIVENVENYELSTGISLFCFTGPSCGKVCIARCIFFWEIRKTICYVTGAATQFSVKNNSKSLQIVNFRFRILFPFDTKQNIFVKNAKSGRSVSSASYGEYLNQADTVLPVIHNIRGYTCREK